jgi:hypothetical protein
MLFINLVFGHPTKNQVDNIYGVITFRGKRMGIIRDVKFCLSGVIKQKHLVCRDRKGAA